MYDDYDNGGGGCLAFLIFAAIVCWISENWTTILLVIGGILAIAAVIIAIKSYEARAPLREGAAKAKAAKEAEEKQVKEAEKRAIEEASYRAYEQAYKESALLSNKLYTANEVLEKLRAETDESKRIKILSFFDRYLPVMTEIIEASKHGDVDIDDSIERFTETVKAFSKTLYKVDDVVDVNQSMMERMAIMDGLYDPYADSFKLSADKVSDAQEQKDNIALKQSDPEVQEVKSTGVGLSSEETPKPVAPNDNTVDEILEEMEIRDRLENAILLDDYDEIRDMIDRGEIDEWDLDDDVIEIVETIKM